MFKEKNGLKRRTTGRMPRVIGPILFLLIAALLLAMSQATSVSLARYEPEIALAPISNWKKRTVFETS